MKDSTWFENFNSNQYFATMAAYFLILIMNICVLFIFVAVGEQLFPNWDGTYIIWIGTIISLEAFITNYLVTQKVERFSLLYRMAEFLIMMVVLKLVLIIRDGWQVDLAVSDNGFVDIYSFFSGEFLVVLIILLSVWGLSNVYSAAVRSLQSYQSDLVLGEFIQIRSERIDARRMISNLYLSVGLVMITLVAIFRSDLSYYRQIIGETLSKGYAIATAPLIVYFLAGLVLLSLSQFAILRGGWLMGKIGIAPKVAANWVKYTAIIFGAAGLFSLLLPTEYTSNFLNSAYFVLQYLLELIMFILGVLVIPFVLLFGLISSLLGSASGEENQPQLPQFDPPSMLTQSNGGLPAWLELLKNLLFWIVLSGGMLFFLWHYIRQNQSWLADFDWKILMGWIGKISQWFRNFFSRTGWQIVKIRRALTDLRNRDSQSIMDTAIFKPVNTKKMNAREKILYYYVSFLEENAKYGYAKKPAQTPAQYAAQLVDLFPAENLSLESITNGFEAARYSRREINPIEANQIEQVWRLLRQKIKKEE